ncbi:hypothetical protein Leryth_021209 [Lithospermum erythrorhizon]|nr:hypothetical protein Leryth_021209 [Lithospermum erythrorhizon]
MFRNQHYLISISEFCFGCLLFSSFYQCQVINASNKFTHSKKKRGKRKVDYRVPQRRVGCQ